MQEIPIGLHNFRIVRELNYLYADKTEFVYKLISSKMPYFLSRPRRFGKSLLVSTLEAALKGRRELFKGLWIDSSDYDWTPSPVIHLSLASIKADSLDVLESELIAILNEIAKREKLSIQAPSSPRFFQSLIQTLKDKYNRDVAVLIDDYDAPILNNIANKELATKICDSLKTFYTVIKDVAEDCGFIFITGITKFTTTSFFSSLNHLYDLTLDKKYVDICGFTINEFDSLFQDHIAATLDEFKDRGYLAAEATVSDLRQTVLDWYDGYSWDGKTRVLNPWSVLNCFMKISFSNFWFSSGSPSFLINIINERRLNFNFLKDDNYITDGTNVVDIGQFEPTPLMFQTGYLTLRTDCPRTGSKFFLDYPNFEVRAALVPLLLSLKEPIKQPLLVAKQARAMLAALTQRDAGGFATAFGSLLSGVPFNALLPYEVYCQKVFLLALALAGQGVTAEGEAGDGRFDAHLRAATGEDFIVEIKYGRVQDFGPFPEDAAGKNERIKKGLENLVARALAQIEGKKYAKKFQGANSRIWKTALVISERTDVMIFFEEASHWILVKEADGRYVVEKT
jgi:hypothetical protein